MEPPVYQVGYSLHDLYSPYGLLGAEALGRTPAWTSSSRDAAAVTWMRHLEARGSERHLDHAVMAFGVRGCRDHLAGDGVTALELDDERLGLAAFVQSIAWSGDGSRLVTTSRDTTARIWDGRDGRE